MSIEFISILVSAASAVIGGLIVAIVNYVLTRRKTSAETEKFKAETEKIRLETEKLTKELQRLSQNVEETSYYRSSSETEVIIFDSSQGMDQFDFEGKGGTLSYDTDKQLAHGNFSIKNDVALVERTNIVGCYTLRLRKYKYLDKNYEFLPKDILLEGKRKLRASCQVRLAIGVTRLVFVMDKNLDKGFEHLEYKEITLQAGEWQNVEFYFRITPDIDSVFKIHQVELSELSTLLVKNIIIAEKRE